MPTINLNTELDARASLTFTLPNGKPIPFNVVTRFVVEHFGPTSTFTVDTLNGGGIIEGTSDGQIIFDYIGMDVEPETYALKITVFDVAHPEGQLISDNCCGPFVFAKIQN